MDGGAAASASPPALVKKDSDLQKLAAGDAVRLNELGTSRFLQRPQAQRTRSSLLRPGEIGTVVRVGKQKGCVGSDGLTAIVRCPRGETHLYWQSELKGGIPSPRSAGAGAPGSPAWTQGSPAELPASPLPMSPCESPPRVGSVGRSAYSSDAPPGDGAAVLRALTQDLRAAVARFEKAVHRPPGSPPPPAGAGSPLRPTPASELLDARRRIHQLEEEAREKDAEIARLRAQLHPQQ